MKKFLILCAVLSFAIAVVAAEKGPAVIDLSKEFGVTKTTKKPVQFPHEFHQSKNQCTECHLSAEGGKELKSIKTGEKLVLGEVKGTKNAAHDEFCWACHEAKKVPSGKSCNKCHK